MKKCVYFVLLCSIINLTATRALSQAAREATIEAETRARIILQSQVSSKLNEPGDPIRATLEEPISVNGQVVLPRGTEFIGRVTEATPARRGQKNGKITIIFERIVMPWGEEPVTVAITAIDDWSTDEKRKADEEGEVKGSRSGSRTAENVQRGATIGGAGALGAILLGGSPAAGGAAIGGGLLGGLLLTKGGDVRVTPGAIFRIKFVKPLTLPVAQQGGASPLQQTPTETQTLIKKP